MSDTLTDYDRGDFAPDYCRSRDPYCSRNPQHVRGTYEEYSGALCGDCEDQQVQDDRDRNTIPAGELGFCAWCNAEDVLDANDMCQRCRKPEKVKANEAR